MTDRAVNKEKIASSSKSINNNDASHHHSSSHHQQSSSHQKEPQTRPNEENLNNDSFLKRYKIIEKIGEGSYSEVLKCQNRKDGTVVACKRLKHIYKSIDDVTNISEIATLRSIQKHSNILQMIEIHYDKTLGKVSLVFELMDINLYELIKDRKRLLPESRVRAIMFQLFRALRHLHKLGVFHRDIKPENILIKTKTDQLKLGDLGSVRGMFSRPPYTEYISTRWYRSPECLLTAGHYSHKMDIWAAGCVFYEVLTLRPLFPGSSEIDQINRINNVLGPPPMKLLETFQKQAEMERDTYRGQSQLNRRQQIQKVLNSYSSRYIIGGENGTKNSSGNSIKSYRRNNMEFHFAGKEGTGLDKILPAHITREAKDIIKQCLLYDPEQRPTANRIVQLSYFSELRDSYSKNPEKVSSKSVVLICGDTATDAGQPIELGTLGDHKSRYRRGVVQKNTTSVKSSASKTGVEKKPSSIKLTDINNNVYSRRRCTSSRESVVIALARASQSRLSNLVAGASASKIKVLERGKVGKADGKGSEVSASGAKSSSTNRVSRMSNVTEQTTAQRRSSRVRSRSSLLGAQELSEMIPEPMKRKTHQQAESSTTSFDSVQSPEINEKKFSRQRDRSSASKDPRRSAIHTLPDISLSPYVKPPSELKFLRNKIKSDRSKGVGSVVVHAGGTYPQKTGTSLEHATAQQQQQPQPVQRVSVVPPKVAAAAIKYVKANARKSRADSVLETNATTDQTESSATNIMTSDVGDVKRRFSPADETTSHATASSVKIGKLRFRQTTLQKQQQQQQQQQQQSSNKSMKDSSTTMSFPVAHPPQRSKIPVLTEDRGGQSARRNTKILATPPEQRRESGTNDKWRNTGIPRMIPMSPERERNIQLLKESLTLDKNNRLKIRYQQQQQLEQDILNNNKVSEVVAQKKVSSTLVQAAGGKGRARKEMASKTKYDYTSQDTLQSTGEQPLATYSSPSCGVGTGKYRNSTTDYENPDAQETSSASAAALENHQRKMFNEATRKGRVVVPPIESIPKKPVAVKKSIDLYPPEMLHLYSSRYRGPDTTMNILKDSGNSYVKRSNPESRTQEVKEKLNQKFEQKRQRQQQLHSNTSVTQQVGDQPSKIFSERSTYARYSSSLLGAGEEEQFSRAVMGASRMERRPPLPAVNVPPKPEHVLRGYRDESPGGAQQYSQQGRRASMIPTSGAERGNRSYRRSSSNAPGERAQREANRKKEKERMRSTMRDDVFCSSDDDVVISMRKKFDSLISERARKLSESLKCNSNVYAQESVHKTLPPRKAIDSNSDDDMIGMARRSRNNDRSDKSKKYARRELRARMAESLTMNNFSVGEKWQVGEHIRQGLLENRASNDSGDWMLPSNTTNKSGIGGGGGNEKSSSYNPSSILRARKNNAESEFQDSLKYHQHANRIHPFPIPEQQVYRRGQIFTPPSHKPVYQSPQLGTMLHDRKLRYSHNNPMPVAGNYVCNTGKGFNEMDTLKKRQQRI